MNDTQTRPIQQTHSLQVKGMSCGHCVKAVTKAIHAQDPQAVVTAELARGRLTVQTLLDREAVAAAIDEEGYEVQG